MTTTPQFPFLNYHALIFITYVCCHCTGLCDKDISIQKFILSVLTGYVTIIDNSSFFLFSILKMCGFYWNNSVHRDNLQFDIGHSKYTEGKTSQTDSYLVILSSKTY